MRVLLILSFVLSSILFSSSSDNKEHIKKQIEKEKKYAKEQRFYTGNEYDLKGAEVDDKSLKNIPKQPDYNDDFDMDSVYD